MEVEIICISSDDESDLQKKNKNLTNLKQTKNGISDFEKTEILFNDSEKVEKNAVKRRNSQVNKDEIVSNSSTKKVKLNSDENISKEETSMPGLYSVYIPEVFPIEYNATEQDEEIITEKMQLIVKEKRKISYVSQDVFPLFISLCLQKCLKEDKTDMTKIIDKLKRRYENLDPTYTTSEDFVTFINNKREAIINDSKKLYVHIQDVMNEMKKKIKERFRALENDKIYDAIPSTSYATITTSVNHKIESDSNNKDNDDDKDDDNDSNENNEKNTNRKIKKKIKQVSCAMKKCEAIIKRLEEEEVDFDDENNSNYIKVERYKRRMVELYNKLCELTGENTDAGRVYLRPKHFNVTQIVAVDQAITNFINSKITRRSEKKRTEENLTNNLIFPDYKDILECINRCNDKKNLGLSEEKRKELAKKAFKELGEHLQRTRRNDYWDTFSLYLEKTEDPALKDKDLAQKLVDNRTEGEKRLTAVFEKYVQKEKEMKIQNNEDISSEEEDDEEEEEGEEEKEEKEEKEEEEEEEEIIIDDDDKNKEENVNKKTIICGKDNGNKKDVNEIVEENNILIKNKPNVNMIKVYRISDKISSNNTEANILQKKCNKSIKPLKTTVIPLSKIKNIKMNNKLIQMSHNSNTILQKVIMNDTKIQKDTTVDPTVNYTKNLPETKVIKISNKANFKIEDRTKDLTDTITETTELITGDTKIQKDTTVDPTVNYTIEQITGEVAELITEDTAEVITESTTELITGDIIENIAESAGENVMNEEMQNIPNDEESEQKKPVLRLRSFAKPPMTWEDSQHKMDKTALENTSKVTNQVKEVVDLTNEETTKSPPITAKRTLQLGNKIVQVVGDIVKHQTVVIPANRNIISVQNITNNYLKVNTRTGQIIAPVRDIQCGSTIIRLPSIQSTSGQNQLQNLNAITVKNNIPLKRNETILRIIPKKSIIISKKSPVQSISKEMDESSSTTKSK